MMYDIKKVRNFSIIAHIDHGKSTLADRIMELTNAIPRRQMKDRLLDTLELEQERGITIKLQTARMFYTYTGNDERFKSDVPYILNLVDTPGHVDFSYEVSRSLAASEGAILLVDATQGIQAQTITTIYKALEYDLEIIPAINKIDMPNVSIESVSKSMLDTFGFKEDDILKTSGKTGAGVEELLNRIVERVPAPKVEPTPYNRALIYDSFYHEYKGVVALVKVVDGNFDMHKQVATIGTGMHVQPIEIGYSTPALVATPILHTGEIGYIATGLKDIKSIHVGDTVTLQEDIDKNPNIQPLPGYQAPKSMVFATLFPIESDRFDEFTEAFEKLALNDAALNYHKESSKALGSGYLCGFLGLLHMEVTQERLTREFDIDLITTAPSVEYKVRLTTTDYSKVENLNVANIDQEGYLRVQTAADFPDESLIEEIQEPWVTLEIITPENYIGPIMELVQNNRGSYKGLEYVADQLINGQKHVQMKYEIPSAEIITNFFDKLKSISQGYASMDYTFLEYRKSDIVKVNIMINYEIVEALCFMSHASNAEVKGRKLVTKLVEIIPRQQIPIPVQAAIGVKIFARESIKAYRKDVLAKMSGGDYSRKRKLLEKQKKGKRKMKSKMIGQIELPQEVFLKALKID